MEVRCNNCEWAGYEEDLILCKDKENGDFFNGCPQCKDDGYLQDIKPRKQEEVSARVIDPTEEIKNQFMEAFQNLDKALRLTILKQLAGEWPRAVIRTVVEEDDKGELQVKIRAEELKE